MTIDLSTDPAQSIVELLTDCLLGYYYQIRAVELAAICGLESSSSNMK